MRSRAFSDACNERLQVLSKELGEDSSSQYSWEVQRLFLDFLAWLPQECHFLEASEGLGIRRQVWLEHGLSMA